MIYVREVTKLTCIVVCIYISSLTQFAYFLSLLELITPILRIGDQLLTFDVFWPKHLQEVRSTVYIHVQSI